MAIYDILPKDGHLRKVDIMQTLNANGGVCDNVFSSLFKPSANINIWSFRKPIDHPNYFRVSDEEMRLSNCGLEPYQIGAYTSLPSIMDGGMNGWEYKRPIGTINSPYRIHDFRGYSTKAAPMIQNFSLPNSVSYQSTAINATAIVMIQGGDSVSLADLKKLRNCHAAVYLKKSNSTLSDMFYNSSKTIADSGTFDVTINPSRMSAGEWTAFPFLLDDYDGTIYYTIPNVQPKTFEIVESLDSLGVVAQYKYSSGGLITAVQFKFTLTNKSGGSTKNNYVCLSRYKDDITPETGNGEYGMSLPDLSVSSMQDYEFPSDYNGDEWYEISVDRFNPSYVNWVVISIGSGRLIRSVNIMQLLPK